MVQPLNTLLTLVVCLAMLKQKQIKIQSTEEGSVDMLNDTDHSTIVILSSISNRNSEHKN